MSRATLGLASCLLCAASLACHGRDAYKKPITAVAAQPVARFSAASGVRYSAAIEPAVRVDLAFKAGGHVRNLLQVRGHDGRLRDVQRGDRVARGTVLATLRETDYLEKRRQAQAVLREAEATSKLAAEDAERAARLFAEQSVTRTDNDAAQTRVEVTRAKVDAARAMLQEVENALGDASLQAPIDAVVLDRRIEPGMLAPPGVPAFVLADTRRVRVVFGAPDVTVRSLRLGAEQTITTAALPGETFRGLVTAIAPQADPRSRVFEVEVTIPNTDDRLKPGMVASLQLDQSQAASAPLVVGLSAIVRPKGRPDGYAVFVVDGKAGQTVARQRDVRLGQAFGNWIAVTDGLTVGELVITRGATLVVDGEPVNVVQR